MTIKNIITESYFRKEYKYNGVIDNDEERVTPETIEAYIGRGSSRVNTILARAVDKGITAGIYEIPDDGNLKVVEAKFPDAAELAEEKLKVEAIKEATAILAKFGIDTGWDFITGSFSASIGTESFSDATDFDTSLTKVETNVKELLANYDFGGLLISADSFRIAVESSDEEITNPPAYVTSGDRVLTEAQLVTRLVDPIWTEGRNGIKIYPKDQTQPGLGIIIELDGGTIDIEAPTDELNKVLVGRFEREAIPTATINLPEYVIILAELFNDFESYILQLEDAAGNIVAVSLKDALQELQKTMESLGTYDADDQAGELDHNETVIRNVVIIRENQKALDLRITANFDKIELKEDKGLAKQLADQALVDAKIYTDTKIAALPKSRILYDETAYDITGKTRQDIFNHFSKYNQKDTLLLGDITLTDELTGSNPKIDNGIMKNCEGYLSHKSNTQIKIEITARSEDTTAHFWIMGANLDLTTIIIDSNIYRKQDLVNKQYVDEQVAGQA